MLKNRRSKPAEKANGYVKRPTMDDVANVAGVSKATVSRVLSGMEDGYTSVTAALVRETAQRLGYVVNSLAASLRSRQTYTVGLVIADVSNPFFGGIAAGVESRLAEDGYSVIFANSGNAIEREKELVGLLAEKQIDGMIIASSTSSGTHILKVQSRGISVVLVDSDIPSLDVDAVLIDNRAAARSAVSHFITRGHQRIATITGPLTATFDIHRLEGYREALMMAGLEFRQDYVLRADLLATGGEKAIAELMKLPVRPSAMFVANNMMTLGALVGLKKAGLTIPEDISLIAFDDQDWYSVHHPPITSILNPAYEMGRAAGTRMLAHLDSRHPVPAPERILLLAPLIERGSVRPWGG
jgi:LacI family transcriptional regulator